MSSVGQYSKFVVALFGVLVNGLSSYYAGSPPHWLPAVIAFATAVTVFLVPNSPAAAPNTGKTTAGPPNNAAGST
jgi:CBS-domain-containing membrane protein